MSAKIRLYEDASHAAQYAKYRPSYPHEVIEAIVAYLREGGGGKRLALDVGCGSGQSTTPLASHFDQVLGVDVSEAQLAQAPKDLPNVQFKVSSAEDLNIIKDSSVDLVTSAQAIHWFDFDVFFAEVHRILKPRGTLAAYGYGIPVLDNQEAHNLIYTFYQETLIPGHYLNKRSLHMMDEYAQIKLPFNDVKRINGLSIKEKMSGAGLMGYIESLASYQHFMAKNPDSKIKQKLQQGVEKAYIDNLSGLIGDVLVTWPVYILLGRKGI